MEWFEPLIIIACVLFVGGVIFLHFYMKKKGKSLSGSCSCGTSNCGGDCKACEVMMKEYRDKMVQDYHKANCSHCQNK